MTLRVEKERLEAQHVECNNAIIDSRLELANAKEDLHVLEGQASSDMSAMNCALKGHARFRPKLATVLSMLQTAKGALPATFDHLKQDFSSVHGP